MTTYAEQLAEVRTAISAVMSGQEYEIDTGSGRRKLRRADLAQLEAREQRLIPLAAQEARGRSGRRTRQIAPG